MLYQHKNGGDLPISDFFDDILHKISPILSVRFNERFK